MIGDPGELTQTKIEEWLSEGGRHVPERAAGSSARWELSGVTALTVNFQVARSAAVAALPTFLTQPLPHYCRLSVLRAEASPVGPLLWAVVALGGRWGSLSRDWVIDWISDGEMLSDAGSGFDFPIRPGRIELNVDDTGGRTTVRDDKGVTLIDIRMGEVMELSPHLIGYVDTAYPVRSGGGAEMRELNLEAAVSKAWTDRHYSMTFGDSGLRRLDELRAVDLIAAMCSSCESAVLTERALLQPAEIPVVAR